MVSTEHGKPSLSYKIENTAELKYMRASVTRRLDRHVANICHAFSIAPFCFTINCRWLSFGFSFHTHFISTQNKKLSVVLTVSYLQCRTCSVVLTVSYLQCCTYSVVLTVSYLQCCTYSVVLTVMYLQCRTCSVVFTVLYLVSYLQCRTYSDVLTVSYLQCRT